MQAIYYAVKKKLDKINKKKQQHWIMYKCIIL